MCHYYEGYHTVLAWEIDGGDTGPRERREELPYDLPWRAIGLFVVAVGGLATSINLIITLLT